MFDVFEAGLRVKKAELLKRTDHASSQPSLNCENDNCNNLLYPSFYATNLLWNKPTLTESIRYTNKKFNINIKLK